MLFLRWIGLLGAVASLVAVVAGNVRAGRSGDTGVLRRSARRLGWGVAAAFAGAGVVYAIAVVGSFGAVAAARPEGKTAVLAGALEEPAAWLRWSVGVVIAALVGVVVLR